VSGGLAELLQRLHRRRFELEEAVRTRVYAIADPNEAEDPVYLHGFQIALHAATDFAFAAARDEERVPPVPPALLIQARLAAFSGVSLDIVLRRYLAGYTVLHDYFVDEADETLDSAVLKRLLRSHATTFERLLAAVSEEYRREAPRQPLTLARRRAEQVRRLLDGEIVEGEMLDYELGVHHLGIFLFGSESLHAIKRLSRSTDSRLLWVEADSGSTWAWLGSRYPLDVSEVQEQARREWRGGFPIGMGEVAEGLAGWRLTHQQAKAAFKVSLRRRESIVRYREVALLASALGDEVLGTSLRDLYLDPVSHGGADGGAGAETLRAYFAAGGKISSAAAALGVNRNTVAERLRAIETRLGCTIASCSAELEVALGLDLLEDPKPLNGPSGLPDMSVIRLAK
jgi:hypothetical protein